MRLQHPQPAGEHREADEARGGADADDDQDTDHSATGKHHADLRQGGAQADDNEQRRDPVTASGGVHGARGHAAQEGQGDRDTDDDDRYTGGDDVARVDVEHHVHERHERQGAQHRQHAGHTEEPPARREDVRLSVNISLSRRAGRLLYCGRTHPGVEDTEEDANGEHHAEKAVVRLTQGPQRHWYDDEPGHHADHHAEVAGGEVPRQLTVARVGMGLRGALPHRLARGLSCRR